MGLEYKDYYKILGVSKTATEDELRKSFRKLAREYHPDVAKDKVKSEEKFKEINEAYEVLSDKEKRQKYDTLGSNWNQGGFQPPPGWQQQGGRGRRGGTAQGEQEFEFGGTGFSDFFEQFFGSQRGRGFSSQEYGAGQDFSQRGNDIEGDIMVSLGEAFNGSVRSVSLKLRNGQNVETKTYQVKIPAGVRDGQRLRLSGKGEAGSGRGAAGDLYLRVRYAKHPDFRLDGTNLIYELAVPVWDAVLGSQASIPTLDGPVSIKIPAGTQASHKLRVRGRGLPGEGGVRGDLLVEIGVKLPLLTTSEERALWEKLKQVSPLEGLS